MSEIRVDKIINEVGTGPVELTQGATFPIGKSISGSGDLNISGASTFQNNIIQTSGLVGIGTTNPLQRFQIGTANTLGINTEGTIFVVTSSADVGIGTTNPTSKLHVVGNANITGSIELGHATDTTLARVSAGVVTIEGVNIVTTSSTDTLTSCTGLSLTTGVTGTLPVANGGTGVTASTGTGSVVLSASPTFTGTVVAAAITATGDISAANFNSTSDISLKDNIQTIVNPLDKIIKLNGVTFNWKENQKPSIGVIAQELEKVLPELVTQGEVKSVNYNGIIGVLIEAIKELKKEVEELKIAKYL